MYKAAGMQWQNASKTHTFLGIHLIHLKGRFEANHNVQSTISRNTHFFSRKTPEIRKKWRVGSCK